MEKMMIILLYDVGDIIVVDKHTEEDEYVMLPNEMGSRKLKWFPPIGTITEVVKTLECNYLLVKFPIQTQSGYTRQTQTTEEIEVKEVMCRESLFRKATRGEKFLYTINNRKIVIPKTEEE